MPPFNPAMIGAPSPVGRGGGGGTDTALGTIIYAASSPGEKYTLCDGTIIAIANPAAFPLPLSFPSSFFPSVTPATVPSSTAMTDVAFANNLFVATGAGGALWTSADGRTWTARTSGVTDTLYGVTYGNGLWVAFGGPQNGVTNTMSVLTSADGITWVKRTVGFLAYCYGITYANGAFYIVGLSGQPSFGIIRSTDGINWSFVYNDTTGYTTGSCKVFYQSSTNRLHVLGFDNSGNGATTGRLYYSNNGGTTWAYYNTGVNLVMDMSFDGLNLVIFAGPPGQTGFSLYKSVDVTLGFQSATSGDAGGPNGVAFFDGTLLASGEAFLICPGNGYVGHYFVGASPIQVKVPPNSGGNRALRAVAQSKDTIVFATGQGVSYLPASVQTMLTLPRLSELAANDANRRRRPYMKVA